MSILKAALGILVVALAFGVVTLIALETGEVVVLVTVDGDGKTRETRAWLAEENDSLWLEAANPDRGFYRDLVAGSPIEVRRGRSVRKYNAFPAPNPQGHRKIRRLLRDKYGWKDSWIGLIADTSGSIGIRLEEIEQR